ncbi:MAG: hypothetical protein GC187_03105 [Alphaproteobacteria bacterium]|nr:hypothetical protein [Alphaproteobacteria bacterium]
MNARPHICLIALAALSLSAPAQAQLHDVLLVEREGGPHLWLAFGRQPAALLMEGGALHVIGVDAEAARSIIPASPAPFAGLRLAPEAGGVSITLDGVAISTAELRAGGVWLTLDAAGWTAPPPAPIAAASTPFAPPRPPAAVANARADAPPADPSPSNPAPEQTQALSPAPAPAIPAPEAPATPAARAAAVNPACAGVAEELEDAPWDLDLIAAQGACLAQAGDSADARVQYERVLAFEPEHARAALGLARLQEAAGELTAAAELYEIAARNARTDGEALEAMAAARRLREASGG